jgi:hypothetical protein
MTGQELIEDFEVPGFLIVHVLHEIAEMRMRAEEGGGLSGVYENCSQLTSLVDA